MKIFFLLLLLASLPVWATDYMYEEQKLVLHDTKGKVLSETLNYRIISTDHKLKRISVETTEVTLAKEFKSRSLYRIYQGPKKQWFLEDTLNRNLKMPLTIRNKDGSDWPIRSYAAVGPTSDGGKQMISFEQTLADSKGRIDFTDWKGQPKGYMMLEGKAIQEAQYLQRLREVKH